MTAHFLTFFLTAIHAALSFTDYCKNHTFDRPNSSQILRFSKENSDKDFGIYDKFKCLHCCCHGYGSIEWFKDGVPYPWPTNVSTLIIRPEAGNQTICSHQPTTVDSGKYSCFARNDTHFLKHEVILQISGPSISMGWPKTTYRPRDQQANRGESVRFFCEAFVGTIDLPDFQSEITWERYDQNESFIDGNRILQEPIFRWCQRLDCLCPFKRKLQKEEKRVLGSYLFFKKVTHQDYGEYTCKIRNLGDQVLTLNAWLKKREEIPARLQKNFWLSFFLLGILTVVASILTVFVVWFALFRLTGSRVSRLSRFLDGGNRKVLVIYHEYNKKEALKAVSGLQGRHFCSYSVLPLRLRSQLMEEVLKAKSNSYTAVLAILSPSLIEWSCEGIHDFIQELLKALPTPKPQSNEWQLLQNSLSKISFIESTSRKKSLKFWNFKWNNGLEKCFVEVDSFQNGISQALI